MENEENEFYEKNEQKFYCELCDYKCSYLSDWKRHLLTRKHFVSHSGKKMEKNGNEKNEKNENPEIYNCELCNNTYKSISGLWKHKKKCNNQKLSDKKLILMLGTFQIIMVLFINQLVEVKMVEVEQEVLESVHHLQFVEQHHIH